MKNFIFGKTVTQADDDATVVTKVYPFSVSHSQEFSGVIASIAQLAQNSSVVDEEGKRGFEVSFEKIQAVLTNVLLGHGAKLLDDCTECEVSYFKPGEDVPTTEKVPVSDLPHFYIPDIIEGFVSVNFSKGRWKKWVKMLDKPLEKLTGEKNFLSTIVSEFLSATESQSEKS